MASPETPGPLAQYILDPPGGTDLAFYDRVGRASGAVVGRADIATDPSDYSQSLPPPIVPAILQMHDKQGRAEETVAGMEPSSQLRVESGVQSSPLTKVLAGSAIATGQETESDSMQKLRLVRVKRKRGEVPVDSLWLETSNTARVKRANVATLGSLSLDDPAAEPPRQAEFASRSLFRLVDTVAFSSLQDDSTHSAILRKIRDHQRRDARKEGGRERHERLQVAAREERQAAARKARYEQVRRSREFGAADQPGDAMSELFHLYDVVRVDVEDKEEEEERRQRAARRESAKREAAQREGQLLCNFLPLLREHVPEAAREVEADLRAAPPPMPSAPLGREEHDYVYDVYYASEERPGEEDMPGLEACPTIQVVEDEDYDWREGPPPDFDSEDSNDENNPHNDYPDEESKEGSEDEALEKELSMALDWLSDEDDVDPYDNGREEYDTVAYDAERDDSDSDEEDEESDKMMWARRK